MQDFILIAVLCIILLLGYGGWIGANRWRARKEDKLIPHRLAAFREILQFLENPREKAIPYDALDIAQLSREFVGVYTGEMRPLRSFGSMRGMIAGNESSFLACAYESSYRKSGTKLTDKAKARIAMEYSRIERLMKEYRGADADLEVIKREITDIRSAILRDIFLPFDD